MPFHHRQGGTEYKVTIVKPKTKGSLDTPVSKGRKRVRNLGRKVMNTLLALMLAFLGLLGTIGAATPAHAGNFIEDGFKSAFCSNGMSFYDLQFKTPLLSPNTGEADAPDATPYEKYATSGLWNTVWLGPERQEGLDDKGEFGGVSIVNYLGGKGASDIDQIGDDVANAKKNEATQKFPGFYNSTQECSPLDAIGASYVSNTISSFTGMVVFVTNVVYQSAYELSSNIMTSVEEPLTLIVTKLRDAVFFEFLTPIIMLGALWMAWVGLVKRSSIEAAQGALWMIMAAVAAVALMSNPMWLPKTANTVVGTVSQAGITAITSVTNDTSGDNMCSVSAPVGASLDNKSRSMVRQFQCTMWQNFLYVPWVQSEFGENPSSPAADGHLLGGWNEAVSSQKINGQIALTEVAPVENVPDGSQNWALYMLDNKVRQAGTSDIDRLEQKKAIINVTVAQLHKDDYNGQFKGENSLDRVGTATLAFVASIGAAVFVVVVSGSIIVLDITLLLLILFSPVFFLVGVHPGFGRRIALGWVELIVGLVIKRIVLSLFLAVMLIFYSVMFQVATASWLISMILIVATSFAGFAFKDKLVAMFDKVSLGGDGSFTSGKEAGKQASQKIKNTVGAAVVGGMMGGGGAAAMGKTGRKGSAVDAVTEKANAMNSAGAGANPKKNPITTTSNKTPDSTVPAPRKEKKEAPVRSQSRSQERVAPEEPAESKQAPVGEKPRESEPSTPTRAEMAKERITVKQDLKEAGYRTHVGVGTIAKAALKGAVVGTVTGHPRAAIRAGSGVVSKAKVIQGQRNAEAIKIAVNQAHLRNAPLPAPKDAEKPATESNPKKPVVPASSTTKAPETKQAPAGGTPEVKRKPASTLPRTPESKPKQVPAPTARKAEPKKGPTSLPALPNKGATAGNHLRKVEPPKRGQGSLPTPRPKQ